MQTALPVRIPAPPRAPHQRSLALTCLLVAMASSCTTNAPARGAGQPLPGSDSRLPTEAASSPASAVQNPEQRRARPWEVTLGGRGTNDEHYTVGGGQLNGSVGYYLTEVVEIAVRQGVSYSDELPGAAGAETSEVWNFDTRIALDLHLPMGDFVPYLGGNVGALYGDSTNDTFAAGPEVGIKWYVKPDAFVHVGAEYEFFFESDENAGDAFDQGQVFYTAGLGLRF